MIPRPVWLIAVFCGLFLAPAFAQRKEPPPGMAPPQPVQLKVKVRREGKTEIPLGIHGVANEPLKFLIRTAPVQGRLSDPRQTGRETAVAVYEPPADLTITTDRFFYAVKSEAGVSAPVEVVLTILDQPPQLTIPDHLDFPAVRTGDSNSKLLEITNSGGSLAIGEVIVEAPWRIEGKAGYRLAAGDLAIFKIIFAPSTGGAFESVARFTSDPAHSTTLRGKAETSVAADPAEVILQNAVDDPVRTGSLELVSQVDEPRDLQLKADNRLQLPAQVTLPGRGRIRIPIQTAAHDVRALDTEIRILAPDLELRVPVKATAPGAVVRAVRPAIGFGRVPVGRVTSTRFELENIGGAPAEVAWTIAAPFRTTQKTVILVPGEKRGFDLEIESSTPGRYRASLQCKSGTQTFDLGVDAEVSATMRPLTGSVRAPGTLPSAPDEPQAPVPTPETPEAINLPPFVPLDWLGDTQLPAGVKVSISTPTTATLEWPASLSSATHFRVDLRQFAFTEDHNLTVNWLELGGLQVSRKGQNYVTTIHDLEPAQPWTVRVRPINNGGEPENRLFAVNFQTPPKTSYRPDISPLRGLLAVLAILVVWQVIARARRR
jgi:hypothetical protein